jgi:predicted DNA-binding transcriptional regulator YafY
MTLAEKLKVLSYLHYLIQRKATGKPEQLAEKLGVCKRTVHNYIEDLKKMGAPVSFCYLSTSYAYTHDWEHTSLESYPSVSN